jgi:opacity protein-like surface antigen
VKKAIGRSQDMKKNAATLVSAAILGVMISGTAYAQTAEPARQAPQPTVPTSEQVAQLGSTSIIPSGVYVRGSLGYSWSTEDEIDYSPLWGIGVGYRFNPNLRADFTIDWRDRYNVEGGEGFTVGGTPIDSKVDNRAYMLNVYYDLDRLPVIQLPGTFKPYIGGGIGLSRIEVNERTVSVNNDFTDFTNDNENQFAWQLMIGAGYNFTPEFTLDLGYRYASLGEVELSSSAGSVSSDLDVHELVATLRYQF